VTFLVNVWLDYRPFNVHPFPGTMVDKMSGCACRAGGGSQMQRRRVGLSFAVPPDRPPATIDAVVPSQASSALSKGKGGRLNTDESEIVNDDEADETRADDTHAFTWPMGNFDSGEVIRMLLPVATIRSAAAAGGSVRIRWEDPDDCLPMLGKDREDADVASENPAPDAGGEIPAAPEPSPLSASPSREQICDVDGAPSAKRVKRGLDPS
jgi:hypothetical protein